jgi:hypothetical protein
MTKFGSSILAVVLLGALATVSVAGQGEPLMTLGQAPPASCHQHGPTPVSQPVSYRCCQSGHDSALLQISFAAQPDSGDLTAGRPIHSLVPTVNNRGQSPGNLATSSADPPDITPLRV